MNPSTMPNGVQVRRSGPVLPFRVPVVPARSAVPAMGLVVVVTAVVAVVAVIA